MRNFWLAIPILACTTSCFVSYRTSISSETAVTPKPENCDFRIVSIPPAMNDYEEIAILTPSSNTWADSPGSFKKAVREDVCRIGGDVVVGEVNGIGRYVRGTVLRKRVAASTQP